MTHGPVTERELMEPPRFTREESVESSMIVRIDLTDDGEQDTYYLR